MAALKNLEILPHLMHLHCGRAMGSRGMGSRITDSSGRSTTSRILTYAPPKDSMRMDRMGRPRSETARRRSRRCYSHGRRCKRVGSPSRGLRSFRIAFVSSTATQLYVDREGGSSTGWCINLTLCAASRGSRGFTVSARAVVHDVWEDDGMY